MSSKRKKRLARFGFILGGLLFLMNGIAALSQTQFVFGLLQLVGALLNFGMLVKLKSIDAKQKLTNYIFGINSIIALVIAFQYVKTGGRYIQYVWILTAVVYMLALITKNKKAINSSA